MCTVFLILFAILKSAQTTNNSLERNGSYEHQNYAYDFEIIDLLGLVNKKSLINTKNTLETSASKFLLEVYETLNMEESDTISDDMIRKKKFLRKKRASEDNFLTNLDKREMENCNTIISFSSRAPVQHSPSLSNHNSWSMNIFFNIKDIPKDLKLVYAALRVYQLPKLQNLQENHNFSVTIYKKNYYKKIDRDYIFVTSLNSSTIYRGWLEFNITQMLSRWIKSKGNKFAESVKELMIEVTDRKSMAMAKMILISPKMVNSMHKHPFIISFLNGPELVEKIHKLRFKREIIARKSRKNNFETKIHKRPPPHVFKHPTSCERLNFTLDFKDLHMHNWIIAPKKFEAYFCGGECSFPLGSRMNTTNHAIVQTLMHLKQPKLPKPCCVPTVLGSISILHYLNEDSVNLSKYPQSVAKECGCH